MTFINPAKLHVRFLSDISSDKLTLPRRYTLTHSDASGDLFLSIGTDYDHHQISGFYTRLMRDEVLAEWVNDNGKITFHIYCHVSGGLIFGSAEWRYRIFQHHLRQVLEAFRQGDDQLFIQKPDLDKANIYVHFISTKVKFNRVEKWGIFQEYH